METGEKYERCKKARRIVGAGSDGKPQFLCKVNGRTVQDCADCTFSILQRPAYLERIAQERDSAE